MTMSENLQPKLFGETELPQMSSQADSRARILALRETSLEYQKRQEADSGLNVLDLLASYDPNTQSLRTSQTCFLAQAKNEGDGLAEYSAIWPQSGMMRSGMLYQLPSLERGIDGVEFGFLPTVKKSEAKGAPRHRYFNSPTYRRNLNEALRNGREDPIYPHPDFCENLMGFPTGWTELKQ